MKVLLVHPSALLYSQVYLRLEPLGMEYVASALREAGHEVQLIDLQIFRHHHFERQLRSFRPDAVGFSVNYLPNVPEVIDLAKRTKEISPEIFVFLGGHSLSFVTQEVLRYGDGAIDCIIQGEGESTAPAMLAGLPQIDAVPGVVTLNAAGPQPTLQANIDRYRPARDLTRKRRKYFIGELDPCASIEFSRGCPWDCSFCSAWTFYGRSYRKADPKWIADEMRRINEPNLFIVDDVAFVHAEHGMAIADAMERLGVRKRFYAETRCDVLIRNEEVFARWTKLGLTYMFLGLESLDAEQLKRFRKRSTPNENFKALEIARKLGIRVAINLITDPSWTEQQFRQAQEWALQVPEIVHLTVATPYPGTELFHSDPPPLTTTDYRLFDIQHAVVPSRLPLRDFYAQLVKTQSIINRKFMGWQTAFGVSRILAGQLVRGQTNFLKMLFRFNRAYNAERFHSDHCKPVRYHLQRSSDANCKMTSKELMIHVPASAQTANARRRRNDLRLLANQGITASGE
ncbi:MAG: hopanoid C-3 methylase HpnR [Gammaproteobacteria bacterium]|jgi:magnesium-protoporphyrin IX monomethyl ester (oxidative) cyclase